MPPNLRELTNHFLQKLWVPASEGTAPQGRDWEKDKGWGCERKDVGVRKLPWSRQSLQRSSESKFNAVLSLPPGPCLNVRVKQHLIRFKRLGHLELRSKLGCLTPTNTDLNLWFRNKFFAPEPPYPSSSWCRHPPGERVGTLKGKQLWKGLEPFSP